MTATTACVAAATSTGGESAEAWWCGREYAVSSTDDQSSELSQQ